MSEDFIFFLQNQQMQFRIIECLFVPQTAAECQRFY